MSASFYDLMKYAKTGIASPGMTAYDKMRAVEMASGGAVKTLTGVPPLSFTGNGKPLISWSMLGNSQQNGTPAPDAPIMPEFVGERTGNIYDKTNVITTLPIGDRYGVYAPFGTYSIYNDTANAVFKFTNDGEGRLEACPPKSTATVNLVSPFQERKSGFFMPYNDESLGDVSIVAGSTPPSSYIPYGWAIPITNAGQTQNVYLGEVQTTRKIKKLVLDGTESAWQEFNNFNLFRVTDMSLNYRAQKDGAICDSLPLVARNELTTNTFCWSSGTIGELIININNYNLADLKTYLNSNPITIWYVLAEPTTSIVNEPLCKIGGYADELHSEDAAVTIPTARGSNTLTVDTDLQPSSMTITYRE